MLPDVNIATEDYGLAHKKQETSTAANEAALTPASEVSADAHRGIEHKAPALDIPGHSAVMIQAAERPASVKDDSAVSVQRDALPQKLGEPGDNTASVRRSLPFDATFALPGLPASVQCALRVWGSQLTANAFLGISRETLEPDTAPASAKYLSARHDAGSIDGGNAHQLQAPDATSVDALYVATDRPSEKYRKTRGWTVINSAPEGAAEDGVAHEPRDLLSDLQDALCFGIGERTSKRERKKAKRLNSVTALSPSQIKTGSHVTRSGTIYRPDAEGSSHPDQPVIEASPAAVTDALSTSHRLARTIGGRVNKTTTAVRAVKEKVNRRLAVQSVETEDDVPKLLKIVRMAFRPPKASRHLQEAGPAPVMAHVLPVERLAKGDIVQMWTDGSGGQKNAGAAFVYRERDGSWRGQQFTLPNEDNALVAEMTALHEALQFAQRLCAGRSSSCLSHRKQPVLIWRARATGYPGDPAFHRLSDELTHLPMVSRASGDLEVFRRKRAGVVCLQERQVLRGQRCHPQRRLGQRPCG